MCNGHKTGNHSMFTQKTPMSISFETSWDELIGDEASETKLQVKGLAYILGELIPDEITDIADVVVRRRWLTNVSVF